MDQSIASFLSGGIAGLAVEVIFYPLDTLTTRIQSPAGLMSTGGFRHLYKGISSVTLISFPYSAVLFGFYESVKRLSQKMSLSPMSTHILAASVGEIAANLVRVPAEVVKQRAQAIKGYNSYSALLYTIRGEGFKGLYRGYQLTLSQDIPFSVIQFVLWEEIKAYYKRVKGRQATPLESGIAGAIGGSVASLITTPFDVARTRVVLSPVGSDLVKVSVPQAVIKIAKDYGILALFKGGFIRVSSYSLGSLAFFIAYEDIVNIISEEKN